MITMNFWQKNILVGGLIILPVFTLAFTSFDAAFARDQWQNSQKAQAQMSNFTQYTNNLQSQVPPGYFKTYSPDFWTNHFKNRLSAGVVLTAILEDDLSSSKSKVGDSFSLLLQDGYTDDGYQLIPANSRIVGTVLTVASAKTFRQGAPGRLDVSLQTIIFPGGQHVPIYAYIDNSNHDLAEAPKKRFAGASLADYGQSVVSMLGSFTSGVGFMINRRNRGADFSLKKGEIIPVRLTRSLPIPEGIATRITLPANSPDNMLGPNMSGSNNHIPELMAAPQAINRGPAYAPPYNSGNQVIGPIPAPDPNDPFNKPIMDNSANQNQRPDPF